MQFKNISLLFFSIILCSFISTGSTFEYSGEDDLVDGTNANPIITTRNVEGAISVKVFPNPVSDKVFIDHPTVTDGTIFICAGRASGVKEVVEIVGTMTSVDVSDYPIGIYTIRLISANGISVKQFVVDR
ncbi:MAG: hypothetical protein ACI959_000400 [Limisphaerales bacterium]|jgi:hypothetical protein